MSFWGWIAIIVGTGVVAAIIQQITLSNKKATLGAALETVDDFNATQKYLGNDGKTGIAIDTERNKACLITSIGSNAYPIVISYRDIISSEIFEDGSTVTSTSRSSQIGGALIGGIALGGVGALIGGLSGKTKSTQKPKRIDLRITVDRTEYPVHDVNFMDIETSRDGVIYTSSMSIARHWHGLISILIRRANETLDQDMRKANHSVSVSDEIRKLAQLREDGLISNEEYEKQKSNLLS